MEISNRIISEIIVEPFIKILRFLIEAGANPKAKVQKLKKYRDLEAKKKIQLQYLQDGQDIKIEKEEKVVKREEKMAEMKQRNGRGKYGKAGVKKAAYGSTAFGRAAPAYNVFGASAAA